jgi:hypothetical protein
VTMMAAAVVVMKVVVMPMMMLLMMVMMVMMVMMTTVFAEWQVSGFHRIATGGRRHRAFREQYTARRGGQIAMWLLMRLKAFRSCESIVVMLLAPGKGVHALCVYGFFA